MFAVFKIMESEHVAGNSLNYDENTCDGLSTSYETVLRYHI